MEKKRKAIYFTASDMDLDGITHLGGKPLVPKGFSWPVYIDLERKETSLLTFIAQFDCEELARINNNCLLPDKGVLLFFYDTENQPWGLDESERGSARVFWFENNDSLIEMDFPLGLSECCILPKINIMLESRESYPAWEDYELISGNMEQYDRYIYWEAYKQLELGDPDGRHKMLGWPDVIQDNMTVQCETVMNHTCDDVAKTLDDWVLLLQLSSLEKDKCEMTFGDYGTLFYYIKKDDLCNKKFENAWCVLQC